VSGWPAREGRDRLSERTLAGSAADLTWHNGTRYAPEIVIRSWADQKTRRLFDRERSRYIAPDIQATALRKLKMLNAAVKINDLLIPPSNRLEKLKGDRAGQWSIAINMQWRICFRWEAGHAYDVEIVDYH
jgi:proteic killer suppression protein